MSVICRYIEFNSYLGMMIMRDMMIEESMKKGEDMMEAKTMVGKIIRVNFIFHFICREC